MSHGSGCTRPRSERDTRAIEFSQQQRLLHVNGKRARRALHPARYAATSTSEPPGKVLLHGTSPELSLCNMAWLLIFGRPLPASLAGSEHTAHRQMSRRITLAYPTKNTEAPRRNQGTSTSFKASILEGDVGIIEDGGRACPRGNRRIHRQILSAAK